MIEENGKVVVFRIHSALSEFVGPYTYLHSGWIHDSPEARKAGRFNCGYGWGGLFPLNDGAYDYDDTMFSGFAEVEQAERWFGSLTTDFAEEGTWYLSAFRVPLEDVRLGRQQTTFRMDRAENLGPILEWKGENNPVPYIYDS